MPDIYHKDIPDNVPASDSKLRAFWHNNVERAFGKIPAKLSFYKETSEKKPDIWDRIDRRLNAENVKANTSVDGRPYVNEYRKLIESELAFFDQQEPHFKVVPDEHLLSQPNNDIPLKRAECVGAYLKKIWAEQKCQKAESRKLYDTINYNVGYTMPEWDEKKMMPYVRYLPARHVAWDCDSTGNVEDANWCCYKEWLTLETFKELFPKVPKIVLDGITQAGKTSLDKEESDIIDDSNILQMHQVAEVTHIFARNAATEGPPKTEQDATKPLSEEIALERRNYTPRRYIVLAEGYEGTIIDDDKWPYDLDHDEMPITALQFNVVNNNRYGFTDYIHMERMDQFGDTVIKRCGKKSREAATTKFGSADTNIVDKDGNLENFLNDDTTTHLPGTVDAEGKQLLVPLDRGKVDPGQLNTYALVKQEVTDATALGELTSFQDAQQYKDVTALAARILEAKAHQKVNRRLNGPWGYEQSINEDAVKLLEIAFQKMPQQSVLQVIKEDEYGQRWQEEIPNIEWAQAKQMLIAGSETQRDLAIVDAQLIRLGVDTIVGSKLAQSWPCNEHIVERRLMMKITVEPGSSRSTTRMEHAAVAKQLYVEVLQPFYEATLDRSRQRDALEMVLNLANIPNIDNLLPSKDELQQKQQQMMSQLVTSSNMPGEAGGQPLNSSPQLQEAALG